MEQKVKKGILYLIPATLGDGPVTDTIPGKVLSLLPAVSCFIVEEVRTARRFLKKAVPAIDIDDLTFLVFNEHSAKSDLEEFIKPPHQWSGCGTAVRGRPSLHCRPGLRNRQTGT